jgi:acetyl-CoA acetyltransferase
MRLMGSGDRAALIEVQDGLTSITLPGKIPTSWYAFHGRQKHRMCRTRKADYSFTGQPRPMRGPGPSQDRRIVVALIVGAADTPVGVVPEFNSTELYALAVRDAAADAGASIHDIDLLITGNARDHAYLYHAEMVCEYLGITPERCISLQTGGASTVSAVAIANAAIEAGDSHFAVIAMADSMATGLGRSNAIEIMSSASHPQWEFQLGATIPALYALIATRYMHDYGITPEEVASVAVSDRYYAHRNDKAQFRDEITIADVVNSRLIADPLRLLDCAPVSDGGCAIAIANDRRFVRDDRPQVPILGYANATTHEHAGQAPSFSTTPAGLTSSLALERAGRTLKDVDIAMIYDAFSFLMCMALENIGFCKEGEGAAFVAAGETLPGGRIPTNTHGGVLSHAAPGRSSGLLLVTEAVRQLYGTCGHRQVDCSTALIDTIGGVNSSHGTLILGREG